jgi:subtilisin family serine protease
MKMIAAAVAIALHGVTLNAYALDSDDAPGQKSSYPLASSATEKSDQYRQQRTVRFTHNPDKNARSHIAKFVYEPGLSGEHTYIVELNEEAVSQNPLSAKALSERKGALSEQRATSTNAAQAISIGENDDAIKQQLRKISTQQNAFMSKARSTISDIKQLAEYQYALNGFALKLTQNEAQALSELPEVLSISRQHIYTTDTDRGPTLIGAPRVWNGSAAPSINSTQGEGVVVGIIDSGVNTDHPSFAEVSGDGFVHTNPLGDGNYLGDCAGNFAELCNNKLIGVYSYSVITNDYADTDVFPPNLPRNGEDYGGHGSHVASTAVGNVLLNVAESLPELNEERSSGVPTGFVFDQISGVAPRANLISYQACYGGRADAGDTYGDCPSAAILASIESAIQDNVDVINFSISGGGNPWNDPADRAFLNARNAGIFVATSAGNSGPDAESSEKNAPWYTSVAASEHGRQNAFVKELRNFSGGASNLGTIPGQSNSGSITASIVYAGDFTNSNDPGGDPAQCLQPFPSGTFNGQIVVCDRGEIARVEKAVNVEAGGAGGYVLANVPGGETFLANDQYVIPGIHINAANGNALKSWLGSGSNHTATITAGVGGQSIDESRVDVLASFSSRGPNATNSTLTPTLTAPGVDIFAAYADEQLGHDGDPPAAGDYNYISGTSMSSPHVAGAAALIKAAHPTWNPDEIRSALSLTATTAVLRQDATTDADFFDMGAGRIQVDQAIASGLIMSETASNYINANPDLNGDPRTLNLPSVTDNSCAANCVWTRTVTATTNATWDVTTESLTDGLNVTVSPSSFTLNEGQTQTLTFTIDSILAPKTEYSFASAKLTSPGLPDANIPVSVLSSIGDIPQEIEFDSRRQIDSTLIRDIEAIDITSFNLTPYLPVKAVMVNGPVSEDSDTGDFLDDLNDGVSLTTITVPDNAVRLIAEIKSSPAPDLDLFVLRDNNGNGIPSNNEIIGQSTSSDSTEEVAIEFPSAGTYFIAVQSFRGSSSQPDSFDMRYAVVTDDVAGDQLTALAPGSISSNTPFDLRVIHNLPDAQEGDDYYAAIGMGTSSGSDDLGMIAVDINRLSDDIVVDGTPTRVDANQVVPLKVIVAANSSNEPREYRIIVPVPVGTEVSTFSTTNSGQLINNELIWVVNKAAGASTPSELNFDLRVLDGVPPGPISVAAKSQLINQSFSLLEDSEVFQKIQVEGAPNVSFNGNDTVNLSVTETQQLTIPISISEPNDDPVTVAWTQTAGPAAPITEVNGVSTLVAPSVEADTQLTYDVVVSDNNAQQTTASITVNVLDNLAPVISSIDAPASATRGQRITIVVNASDPEDDELSISVNGTAATGNSVSLTTPSAGTTVNYSVRVSDGVSTVTQNVSVALTAPVTPPSSGGGGGGSLGLITLLLLPLALLRRRFMKGALKT